jgi:hypothetical protein
VSIMQLCTADTECDLSYQPREPLPQPITLATASAVSVVDDLLTLVSSCVMM